MNLPPMLSKRSLPDWLWVFALVLAVRLPVLCRFGDSAYFLPTAHDMQFYADWARRIAAGQGAEPHAFYGLPGYPFLLGGIFALIGFDPFAVGVLQTLSEAGIAALIFQIAGWAFPGPRARIAGGLAALGWAFFQPAQAFSVILMPTTWAVLAFWGIFCWSVRTESRSLWRPWAAMGVVIGLAATLVATVLFVLPIPLAAAARNLRRPAAVLAVAACLLAGVAAGTAPCWVHNVFIAGEPVFLSAHGGVNFWVGNHPGANGYPKMPPGLRASQQGMLHDSLRVAQAEAGRPLSRAEVSQFWEAKARAFIREHPGAWLKLMALKLHHLCNAAQYDDLSIVSPLAEEGVLPPGLRFGWVAALAIPGLALAWRCHPRARWIASGVALHMAALLPVFVTERYRLAAVPGLLLLAGHGLAELGGAMAARGWRRAAIWGCAALLGGLLVQLPPRDSTPSCLDTYNSGLKALETGDLAKALPRLEHAVACVPENAEFQAALGNYWLHAGDLPRARQYYTEALRRDPRTLSALNNLALLEITENHWAAARKCIAEALRVEPGDARLLELAAACDRAMQPAATSPAP